MGYPILFNLLQKIHDLPRLAVELVVYEARSLPARQTVAQLSRGVGIYLSFPLHTLNQEFYSVTLSFGTIAGPITITMAVGTLVIITLVVPLYIVTFHLGAKIGRNYAIVWLGRPPLKRNIALFEQ